MKQVLNALKHFANLEDQFVENGVVFFMTLMFESYFWKINFVYSVDCILCKRANILTLQTAMISDLEIKVENSL